MGGPTVTVKQGSILGTTGTNLDGDEFYKFLGIPYAKPPVGPLRFKAPQAAESWEGVRECTSDDTSCLALDPMTQKTSGSEDCLYLNVHTRALPKPGLEPKPVMVFFHGGAFTVGSGTQLMCDPEYLLTQDIVLVSLNYRLGIFGFLSLDDTSLEVPGNAGLKDQTFALKWVQENIASFNGDPNNVTIFGVSAGGASVHFQILSPSAKGLFHKAIAQSGSALNPWAWGQKNAIQVAQKLENNVTNEKEALDILVNTPAEKLFKASLTIPDKILEISTRRPFSPVIEKPNPTAFLTEDPYTILSKGTFNQVPLIQGVCSNEGLIRDYPMAGDMMAFDPAKNIIPWNIHQNGKPNPSWLEKVKDLYYKDGVTNDGIREHVSDAGFGVGVFESTKLAIKNSVHPIYTYVFSYDVPLGNALKNLINLGHVAGSSHGIDGNFLFPSKWGGLLTTALTDEDEKAVRRVVEIWTDFARTGNPHPMWEPVTDENDIKYLYIDKEMELRTNPFEKRLSVWSNIIKEAGAIDNFAQEKPN